MIDTKIKGLLGYTLLGIHFVGMWIVRLLFGKYLAEKKTQELNWIRVISGAVLISIAILALIALTEMLFNQEKFSDVFSFKRGLIFILVGVGVSIGFQYAKEALLRRHPDVML